MANEYDREITNILKRAVSVEKSPLLSGVSKLVCNLNDDGQLSYGNDTGYSLEFDAPLWSTSGYPDELSGLLSRLQGYQYQPYTAEDAQLDPSYEIGDGIYVNGLFSTIFNRDRLFNRLMTADISAPKDEEIDHEYAFEYEQDRKVKRQLGQVRTELRIQAGEIAAEVSQRISDVESISSTLQLHTDEITAKVSKSGGSAESFSWSLLSNEFGLYSGLTKVFYVNANGAYIDGEIQASSGKIGGFTITDTLLSNWENNRGIWMSSVPWQSDNPLTNNVVFQIGNSFYVYNNGDLRASNLIATGGTIGGFKITNNEISNWDDTNKTGIWMSARSSGNVLYVGNNFIVDAYGNVKANNMTLSGTLKVGSSNITANNLRLGAEYANAGHVSWDGAAVSTSAGGYCYGGATNGNHAYGRAREAWIGSYRLSFGTGITILGGEFYDGDGRQCSGSATRSNVVTAAYAGGYD